MQWYRTREMAPGLLRGAARYNGTGPGRWTDRIRRRPLLDNALNSVPGWFLCVTSERNRRLAAGQLQQEHQ